MKKYLLNTPRSKIKESLSRPKSISYLRQFTAAPRAHQPILSEPDLPDTGYFQPVWTGQEGGRRKEAFVTLIPLYLHHGGLCTGGDPMVCLCQ